MFPTFIKKAELANSSFVIFRDRLYCVKAQGSSGDYITQKIGSRKIVYPLSAGVPLSHVEDSDKLIYFSEFSELKNNYIKNNLELNVSAAEFMERYKLLRFIVDDIFPRMIHSSLDDRINSGNTGSRVKTGKEIVEEAFGGKIKHSSVSIDLKKNMVERMKKDAEDFPCSVPVCFEDAFLTRGSEGLTGFDSKEKSVFYELTKGVPILFFGGKAYTCRHESDSDLVVKIQNYKLGYNRIPVNMREVESAYDNFLMRQLKRDAALDLQRDIDKITDNVLEDVHYMPLMDVDEFSFRDVGFFRDKKKYYVYVKLPKFARQTTYDENLFAAKEFDPDGHAGEICISLRMEGGCVSYADQKVAYRGPIKNDAPFTSTFDLADPSMAAKYGMLRTICHVGGYPHFPSTADGFMQFMDYALWNFLDSFRQGFRDRHFDQQEMADLLDSGKLLRKQRALELGYLLTNIHEVEK